MNAFGQTTASLPGPIRFLVTLLRRVFKDPVVYGRLRAIQWPRGLGNVVGLSVLLYRIAMLITVFGPWLRTRMALEAYGGDGTAPVALLWELLGLIYFVLALFQTGTLHAVWWVRLLGLVVSFGVPLSQEEFWMIRKGPSRMQVWVTE